MFIIDQFEYQDGRVVDKQIGGGGTYAILGSRLFLLPYVPIAVAIAILINIC